MGPMTHAVRIRDLCSRDPSPMQLGLATCVAVTCARCSGIIWKIKFYLDFVMSVSLKILKNNKPMHAIELGLRGHVWDGFLV